MFVEDVSIQTVWGLVVRIIYSVIISAPCVSASNSLVCYSRTASYKLKKMAKELLSQLVRNLLHLLRCQQRISFNKYY
uniref:Uncharacterized protein n=1 Tax=Arundo donax TaxID=35708 RepID=A0A0A9FQU0_ARUDO